MKKFDLLVIGSGPSGSRVAEKCAEAGWSVAIAESRAFGGTCALRGCNPKKVFVHAAEVVDAARRSDGKLCRAGDIGINWPELLAFKKTFTDSIPKNSREAFEEKGIVTFEVSPQFVSPTRLMIGDTEVEPKHVVIATGARPRPLDFEGEKLLTLSDEFMELKELPKRIAFIGGGYISFEFAHVANRAGATATVLEQASRPLSQFEETIVDKLVSKSESIGIEVHCDAKVERIERTDDGSLKVSYEKSGSSQSIDVDLVVHGAGRVPNLDGLDLEKGNVDFDQSKGVLVNGDMQSTSNEIVHATGDCAASDAQRLTPVANQDGYTVADNLLGPAGNHPSYGPVPAVVFTIPPLASVGLTQQAAEKHDKKFRIEEGDLSDSGSVKKVCQSHAAYKLVIDKDTDRILGAHLIGPAAGETINIFAVAMKFDITASDLKSVLFAFPTFSDNIGSMV